MSADNIKKHSIGGYSFYIVDTDTKKYVIGGVPERYADEYIITAAAADAVVLLTANPEFSGSLSALLELKPDMEIYGGSAALRNIKEILNTRNGGLAILNGICKVYLTIIRGTPVMIQLLIIYYVVLASVTNKILVAVIAFGLNSAAYVAEIVRSGIMSVDIGQFEAGRSLGLNYSQTMKLVIIPQAVKNILPALLNEFISLLKETSISGYIGMMDLTKGGDIIRSNTYEAFIPLIAVALIYLVIVMLLSHGVSKLERRLRSNER